MYVFLLKGRKAEFNVAQNMNYCFSNDVVPLFEIINELYNPKYKLDPKTGDYLLVLKENAKKRSKVKLNPLDEDVNTLEKISGYLNGKIAFIDYFRFSTDKYGNRISLSKVLLARKLSADASKYYEKLITIANYENLIPVLSVKKSFTLKMHELEEIINQLQLRSKKIAIRVEYAYFEEMFETIRGLLRSEDFVLFDIGNLSIKSCKIELEFFKDAEILAKKIVLNSPRRKEIKNGLYENQEITKYIDNSVASRFKEFDFEGYGDYGGLKDVLPEDVVNSGKGAALSLLYSYNKNAFYSFSNSDTKLGVSGYKSVVDGILSMKVDLDPIGDCPAMQKIVQMKDSGKFGIWSTWNEITLTRYLHQLYANWGK